MRKKRVKALKKIWSDNAPKGNPKLNTGFRRFKKDYVRGIIKIKDGEIYE